MLITLLLSAAFAHDNAVLVQGSPRLQQEVCFDGIDNDRDGQIDEGCGSEQAPSGNVAGARDYIVLSVVSPGDSDEMEIQPRPWDVVVDGAHVVTNPSVDSDRGAVTLVGDLDTAGSSVGFTELTGAAGDRLGSDVAFLLPASSSDTDSMLIGAAGSDVVYVVDDAWSGSSGSISGAASTAWYGPAGSGFGGQLASVGDLDSDGYTDTAVGADGAVYLVLGEAGVKRTISSSAVSITGATGEDLGAALERAGDLDGDGLDDLIIGAPGTSSGKGAALVFRGDTLAGATGVLSAADADRTWTGESAGDEAGASLAGVGDTDGDGYDDWLVASPGADWGGAGSGTCYLITDHAASGVLWGAELIVDGAAAGDHLGARIDGGDVDGDGKADLLLSAPGSDLGGTDGGAVYLLLDGLSGLHSVDDVGNVWYGSASSALPGPAALVDADGDGRADLSFLNSDGELVSLWADRLD